MRWISDRAIPVLVVIFCVGVAVVLWQQRRLHERLIHSAAQAEAQRFAATLETFRTLYTSEVVATVREHEIEVTHDYDSEAKRGDAIPLPATLSMKLGNELGAKLQGGHTRLYSAFPFPYPGRNGLDDQFAQDAWEALNRNPNVPYQQFVDVDGRLMLRYAIADRMRQSCVNCHNSHPDSPRRDWKADDVRGVLEVSLPLDVATSQVSANMRESFLLLTGVGGIGLVGLMIVIGRLRQTSVELEQRVAERTSALQQTTQSLERQEAHSRIVIDSSPVALIVTNRSGEIVRMNRQAELLFGYLQDELLGQQIEVLVPEPVRDGHITLRNQYFENPIARAVGEGRLLHGTRKDGTEIPIEIGLTPIETDDGPAALSAVMDLRERMQAEGKLSRQAEELRAAKDDADRANRAKSAFLANMSHEIRTPMNGIIGTCEILSNSDLQTEQREFLTIMRQSADALLRLINDILDFSKIEAGRLELEDLPFSLRDCVGVVGRTLSTAAAEKQLELACRVAPQIPDIVRGDSGRLQQVLFNLAGNAIKFTDAGEVVIDVDSKPSSGDERLLLTVSVRDTGIGIPQDRQQDVFQSFSQADTSTTRRFGGTGLGLAISAQIVELMHGEITVESRPGEGSTFRFTAELGIEPDQTDNEPASLSNLEGMRVLVVDDNATNRRILQEVLLNWHLQPMMADSGPLGLQILDAARQTDDPVPLVLLDCMMPDMDGFEFAQRARSAAGSSKLTIIMISSAMQPGDADRCRTLGIARCMPKPVIQAELLGAISAEFNDQSLELQTIEPDSNAARAAPRRILIAEDGVTNQRVACALLEHTGHQVVVVADGQQAVDMLEHEAFDVVLMDIQMPVLDGYAATAVIREIELSTGEHQPIVAMTANAMKGDRELCLSAGMDDYVSKPLDPAELLRAVEAVPARVLAEQSSDGKPQPTLQLQHSDELADTSPVHSTSPAAPASAGDPDATLIDWKRARRSMPGGDAFVCEMVELLLTEAPGLVEQIRAGFENNDAEAVRRAAHMLKSSVGTFGALALHTVIEQIEMLAKKGTLASIEPPLKQAESLTVRLTSELQTFLADTLQPPDN